MRAALTGRATSPGIFDVLVLLGREESLARIADRMNGEGSEMADEGHSDDRRQRATIMPCCSGTVGPDVIDIRKLYAQTGAFTYDPGFTSTAACQSAITYIDGDEGILLHRGYPIDQLAEHSTFMEVAYLLLNGELPKQDELGRLHLHDHAPHHAARAARHLLSRLPARRPPDGDHVRRGRRAFRLLPRFDRHHRSQAADDRQSTG